MKIELKFFVVPFLLVTSVWAGRWTIDSFDDSPDPGEPDKFIAAESGGDLTPIGPEQVSEQEGVLYVRQKFEDDLYEEALYQLFRGKPGPQARNLGRIRLEGIPYATLLKMKLFYNKKADPKDDLENVYFDGKDIFVEGEKSVYINLNGKMEELKPVIVREYKISITSEPLEAAVSVGNVNRGVTPTSITVSSSKIIAVIVSKEGYYTAVKPVTPVDGETVEEKFILTERVPLVNPVTAYRTQLEPAVANKDARAIRDVRANVMLTMSKYTEETKKKIDSALTNFPVNPSKLSDESQEDFSARRGFWTGAQDREKNILNREAADYYAQLKEFLASVDAALEELDFTLKYEYIPASAITITNSGIRDFSINTEINNSRVTFRANASKVGYGTVSRNEIMQNTGKIHGVLKIWDIPNENGNFASVYQIAIFFGETQLPVLVKGTLVIEGATATSRSTENDLNKRIEKYSGKAAWMQKDTVATLAVLRAGEIPDPTAIASAPPLEEEEYEEDDEAYYDDEEDDDEFEEEMDSQRRADYARSGATRSATDIFGNTDEYIFWSAVAFAAVTLGTGIVGFIENSKYLDAVDAIKSADAQIDQTMTMIRNACGDDTKCVDDWVALSKQEPIPGSNEDISALWYADQNKAHNTKVRKSYNNSRITWFSVAGASAVISITLFLW